MTESKRIEALIAEAAKKLPEIIRAKSSKPESLSSLEIEEASLAALKTIAAKTSPPTIVTLFGGQKFPDIVISSNGEKTGVEIKSTRTNSNPWTIPGGSIMEGNRIADIPDIWLLFTRLAQHVETRHGLYKNHVKGIAVTHSPRYILDMDILPEDCFFTKNNLSYEEMIAHPSPFDLVRDILEKLAKESKAHLWWSKDNTDSTAPLLIRFWEDLLPDEKNELMAMAFILFPNDILSTRGRDKYKRFSLWLLCQHSVLKSSLRDLFSAGGMVEIFPGTPKAPKVIAILKSYLGQIKSILPGLSKKDLKDYWPTSSLNKIKNSNISDIWAGLVMDQEISITNIRVITRLLEN